MATVSIFIPDGIVQEYSALTGNNIDKSGELITTRVQQLVDLYVHNGMQAYWTKVDLLCLHVAVSNHLLSRLDSDAAINDVETYENVYVHLEEWITTWCTTPKRSTFDAAVYDVKRGLSVAHLDALVAVLKAATTYTVEGVNLVTDDDRTLFESMQRVKTACAKAEWLKLRLDLVVAMLTPVYDNLHSVPEVEEKLEQPLEIVQVVSEQIDEASRNSVVDKPTTLSLSSVFGRRGL